MLAFYFVVIYTNNEGGSGIGFEEITLFIVLSLTASSLALSHKIRNNLRVKIDKHFFKHKYDYRSVWLNLIHTLSQIDKEEDFFDQGLKAVGKIFDAEGGALWLTDENSFNLKSSWNVNQSLNDRIASSSDFLQPFSDEEWIYALNISGRKEHDRYLQRLPQWIKSIEDVWILAPLMLSNKMLGFFILTRKSNNDPLILSLIHI